MGKRLGKKRGPMYDPNLLLQKTKLRIDEAAELLDVAPRTVERYMSDGKIAFTLTPGGSRRPLTDSVRKYL
jgi:excisionase family DNA binding protein